MSCTLLDGFPYYPIIELHNIFWGAGQGLSNIYIGKVLGYLSPMYCLRQKCYTNHPHFLISPTFNNNSSSNNNNNYNNNNEDNTFLANTPLHNIDTASSGNAFIIIA